MPAKNLTLYAKWLPDDIYYFLVLRKEGEDGKWSQTTKIQIGKTDETVAIDPAEFLTEAEKGIYTIPETVQYTVSAEDGGTVSISYARKWFSLTYDLNAADAGWVSDPGVRQYRVGAVLELLTQSHVKRAGYTFDGWYTDVDCTTEFTAATMPAEDLTLYAKWLPDDIYYFLGRRKEGEDGKGSQTTKIQSVKTDETVAIDPAEFLTEAEKGIYTTVSYTQLPHTARPRRWRFWVSPPHSGAHTAHTRSLLSTHPIWLSLIHIWDWQCTWLLQR